MINKDLQETTALKHADQMNEFDESDTYNALKKHEDVLKFSLSLIERICAISFFETFFAVSRSAVWILYAQTFESSIPYIAMCKCLIELLAAKKFGYDKVILFIMITVLIGTLLESITTDFITVVIGFCLTQSPMISVCLTFVMYVAPRHYSTKISLKYSAYI